MTDKTFDLQPGHRRIIQRGPKPATGWIPDGYTTLADEDSVSIPALTTTPPPDPEPEPEPEPEPIGAAVGYGKSVTGGTTPVTARTLAELKAALAKSGSLVRLEVPINLAAGSVDIASNVTLEGKGETTMLGNGWIRAVGDNIIIRNVAAWCGDQASVEADTFNANGSSSNPVQKLVIDHCLFLWGVDVTCVFLNNVQDFTIQNSVIAEGLYLSKHPEAVESQGGHSMALNCTNINGPGQPAPVRGTFYRNALINCAERNGRFMGPDQIDLIENLLYGWTDPKGFHGAPRGLNCVNNLYVKGAKSVVPIAPFTLATSADEPKLYPDAVYASGNVAIGFGFKSVSGFRTSPKAPLSVATTRAPLLDEALAWVGPTDRGKQMQRLIADVKAGRSTYVNGTGKPNSYTSLL